MTIVSGGWWMEFVSEWGRRNERKTNTKVVPAHNSLFFYDCMIKINISSKRKWCHFLVKFMIVQELFSEGNNVQLITMRWIGSVRNSIHRRKYSPTTIETRNVDKLRQTSHKVGKEPKQPEICASDKRVYYRRKFEHLVSGGRRRKVGLARIGLICVGGKEIRNRSVLIEVRFFLCSSKVCHRSRSFIINSMQTLHKMMKEAE